MSSRRRKTHDGDMIAIYVEANKLLPNPSSENIKRLRDLRERAHTAPQKKEDSHAMYPRLDESDFNQALARKKEFAEHRAEAVQRGVDYDAMWQEHCDQRNFRLSRDQLFVRNFMSPHTPYNGVLLFHGTGVGKTCSTVTIAEHYTDRKVFVLTRPALADGFRSNIYDVRRIPSGPDGELDFEAITQCTGTKYSDAVRDRRSLTREQLEAKIAKLIRAKYTFMGIGQFRNVIDAMGDGELAVQRIRSRFSHSVVIVDEAHNLRGDDNRPVAPALRKVLETADDVKLVVLTATPMFNHVVDIVPLLNLLRANEKSKPLRPRELFDRNGDFVPGGERRLQDATRGYVSFMRVDHPFSFPVRLTPAVNRDPLVVRTMPSVDFRGASIPADRRIAGLVICGSLMGQEQQRVHAEIESRIEREGDAAYGEDGGEGDGGDDGGGEGDGGEDDGEENARNVLYVGQQVCNIVFPVSAGTPYGKAAFFNVFRRVDGARQLQISNKPGVRRFLQQPHIAQYAPKIATIVDRISRCGGIAMVYSRWIWTGIVPIAIALEHAGFSRFESSPLLSDVASGGGPRYAIISGERNVSTDVVKVLRAARSPANADGSVVKVVIISDKGTEGLDFRYVREVHVTEPWYHMNKIEQIVGRASHRCSHVALPVGKRNVTVYLHAVVDGRHEGRRETVDMRVYRIAERKQRAIKRVESLLRDNSIDCAVHLHSLYYDRAKMGVRIDLLTSQGTVVKGHSIGDAADEKPTCVPPPGDADESTYDNRWHAYHLHVYCRHVVDFFRSTTQPASYSELWGFVSGRVKDARRELLNITLDDVMDNAIEIVRDDGRRGTMVYRGDSYLFQPSDDDSPFLADWERVEVPRSRRVYAVDRARISKGPGIDTSAAEHVEPMLRKRVRDWTMRMQAAALDIDGAAIKDAVVGAVVDRLSHAEVLQSGAMLMRPESAAFRRTDLGRRAVASMTQSGVLDVRRRQIRSPYDPPGTARCVDDGAEATVPCATGDGDDAAPPPTGLVLAVIKPMPCANTCVFKILGGGENSEGFVCYQTWTLTTEDLTRLIGMVTKGVAAQAGKRALCDVYEIALRAARPTSILRPLRGRLYLKCSGVKGVN